MMIMRAVDVVVGSIKIAVLYWLSQEWDECTRHVQSFQLINSVITRSIQPFVIHQPERALLIPHTLQIQFWSIFYPPSRSVFSYTRGYCVKIASLLAL
jgi:hypothetical protein